MAAPATLRTPLGLVMKAGAWYLAGGVGSTVHVYRVDAMRNLEVTGEPPERPRNFDLTRFPTEAARSFEKRLRGEKARVRLSPEGIKLLRDWNPAAADAIAAQQPKASEDSRIEAEIL